MKSRTKNLKLVALLSTALVGVTGFGIANVTAYADDVIDTEAELKAALANDGEVTLGIGFDKESRNITFCMRDKGVPFDPLKKPDPDITLSAEEREIGGLGIFITKKTMDSVEYSFENGENILTMTKKI